MRALATVLTVVAVSLGAGPARAQEPSTSLELQLFLPPPTPGSTFTIDRPTVPSHLGVVVGLGGSYALEPLARRATDGTPFEAGAVVRSLSQVELLAALGLFEYLELGLALPLVISDAATSPLAEVLDHEVRLGAGDLRLSGKVPLLRGDAGLAARLVVQLPLGVQGHFISQDYWVVSPTLTFAWDAGPLTVAAEAGYRFRHRRTLADLEVAGEMHATAGFGTRLSPVFELIWETQARVGVGGRTLRSNEVPIEGDGGIRLHLGALTVDAGVGTAFRRGYGATGFRAFVLVRLGLEQEPCRTGPEDDDGFQDGDFCRDDDNDGDGLLDPVDECPNDAEDADGFADRDGCPDTDNDADGVGDREDACPTISEDRDGFQDADGCPEPDNDADGIADGFDDCTMEPEDRDGYQDEDGCPEPGPERAAVTVTDTRILISERIYFDFDRDTLRSVSQPVLDQVAEVIAELPSDLRIRVDGYSDAEGGEDYNLDLSYRRARAVVEYMISRGVPRARLEYRGYGSRNPVAPNDSPDGRALNRRVEFTILQRGESREGGGARPSRSRPRR